MKCFQCGNEDYYWYANQTDTYSNGMIRVIQWYCSNCHHENREYYPKLEKEVSK